MIRCSPRRETNWLRGRQPKRRSLLSWLNRSSQPRCTKQLHRGPLPYLRPLPHLTRKHRLLLHPRLVRCLFCSETSLLPHCQQPLCPLKCLHRSKHLQIHPPNLARLHTQPNLQLTYRCPPSHRHRHTAQARTHLQQRTPATFPPTRNCLAHQRHRQLSPLMR